MLRQALPGESICGGGHIANSGRVDPAVVEVEQGTHGDRVVEGFLRPPGLLRGIDVRLRDLPPLRTHLDYPVAEDPFGGLRFDFVEIHRLHHGSSSARPSRKRKRRPSLSVAYASGSEPWQHWQWYSSPDYKGLYRTRTT